MNAFAKSILVVVGGLVGWEALRYFAIQSMDFVLASVSPSQSGLVTTLNIVIQVHNPAPQSNTLESLSGVVSINGTYIANVSTSGPQTIGGKGITPVALAARVDDINLVTLVLSVLGGGIGQGTVVFTGTAGVDSFSIPVNLTYQLVA